MLVSPWEGEHFSEPVLCSCSQHCRERASKLHKRTTYGKKPTNAIELRRHFLFSWLCGLSNISTHKFWSTDLQRNSVIHNFSLPPHTRYVDLKQSIRGFSLEGRRGDHDDVWNQKNVCSQNYATLKSQCLNRQ